MIFDTHKISPSEIDERCQEALELEIGLGKERDVTLAREIYDHAAYLGSHYAQNKVQLLDPSSKKKMKLLLYNPLDSQLDEFARAEQIQEKAPLRKLLIIDDAPDMLLIFRKMLEKCDFKVITAENGNQAFKEIQKHPDICCVFVDLKMPEMNGFEFLGLIRKMQVLDKVPIVVETAFTNIELVQMGKKFQVSAWVKKPFDEIKILEILNHVLKG